MIYQNKKINKQLLNFREVNASDLKILFTWSNDDHVRKNSLKKQKITMNDHNLWFNKYMLNSKNLSWIFNDTNNDIGLVRFDLKIKNDYLSYLISKPFRGMGLSKIMLKMAIKKKIKIRNNNITAVSFIENEISNKILLSLDFKIFSKNINTFNYRYSYNN